MKKKNIFILLGVILIVILSIVIYKIVSKEEEVLTSSEDIDVYVDTDDTVIDWSSYEVFDKKLDSSIIIDKSGIYNLTGNIDDGYITIDTDGEVKLVLNNVSIKNSKGPSIYVKNANEVVITLSDNSNNYLEDGESYDIDDEDANGVIFSHDDLTIEGNGSLEIVSNYQNGIVSKDDLTINSGSYDIDASGDGIKGKDSVHIKGGNFKINSLGDGIQSSNAEDVNKGYILIEDGTFNITSELDGIVAENKLLINNGEFNITCGGGSKTDSVMYDNFWDRVSNDSSVSAKGLKSGDNLVISNGTIKIDSMDDSIHSNNYIGIKNGKIEVSSSDDGIHADSEILIDGGTILVNKSYEGLEAGSITINNGDIDLISSDDGINISGGNDSSSMGRPGENSFSNTNQVLKINNGNIFVNAEGDGIDVNGSAYISGGNIIVDGPSDNGNGALDYDTEFSISGGSFVASGSSGMAQSLSDNSSQYNILVNLSETISSSDTLTIKSDSGEEILTYQSKKSYSSLVFSNNLLKKGSSYTIYINYEEYDSFIIDNIVTTIGNSFGGNMGGRGPGGNQPPGGRR